MLTYFVQNMLCLGIKYGAAHHRFIDVYDWQYGKTNRFWEVYKSPASPASPASFTRITHLQVGSQQSSTLSLNDSIESNVILVFKIEILI